MGCVHSFPIEIVEFPEGISTKKTVDTPLHHSLPSYLDPPIRYIPLYPIISHYIPLHNWLVVDPPLWKIWVSNSWDDDISNIWEVIKAMFQSTKQYKNIPLIKMPFISHIYICPISHVLVASQYHVPSPISSNPIIPSSWAKRLELFRFFIEIPEIGLGGMENRWDPWKNHGKSRGDGNPMGIWKSLVWSHKNGDGLTMEWRGWMENPDPYLFRRNKT